MASAARTLKNQGLTIEITHTPYRGTEQTTLNALVNQKTILTVYSNLTDRFKGFRVQIFDSPIRIKENDTLTWEGITKTVQAVNGLVKNASGDLYLYDLEVI